MLFFWPALRSPRPNCCYRWSCSPWVAFEKMWCSFRLCWKNLKDRWTTIKDIYSENGNQKGRKRRKQSRADESGKPLQQVAEGLAQRHFGWPRLRSFQPWPQVISSPAGIWGPVTANGRSWKHQILQYARRWATCFPARFAFDLSLHVAISCVCSRLFVCLFAITCMRSWWNSWYWMLVAGVVFTCVH